MVSRQFHYVKEVLFMPFLSAEILNFQGSIHNIGVGSFINTKDNNNPLATAFPHINNISHKS